MTIHSRRRHLRALGALAFAGAGCGDASPARTPEAGAGHGGRSAAAGAGASATSSATATSPAARIAPEEIKGLIEGDRFSSSLLARRTNVVYTWTTAKQIAELRASRRLLVRSSSSKGERSYVERILSFEAERGNQYAAMLRSEAFANMRFTWPVPYATFLGGDAGGYGNELVRVTLKPEAWLVVLHSRNLSLRIEDLESNIVPDEVALKTPERFGAIHFFHEGCRGGTCVERSTFSVMPPNEMTDVPSYREIVLMNEPMIQEVAYATPAVTRAVAENVAVLRWFARALAKQPFREATDERAFDRLVATVWNGQPEALADHAPLAESRAYFESLAFANRAYYPEPERLSRLATALEALRFGEPFSFSPSTPFDRTLVDKHLAPLTPPLRLD